MPRRGPSFLPPFQRQARVPSARSLAPAVESPKVPAGASIPDTASVVGFPWLAFGPAFLFASNVRRFQRS